MGCERLGRADPQIGLGPAGGRWPAARVSHRRSQPRGL